MGFTTLPGNERIRRPHGRSAVLTDHELLARAGEGDSRAFGELFDRHSVAVYRYAWALIRHDADAQELLQDTFVTAWDRRRSIRLVGDTALPWLLVTARNHALNLKRHNSYRFTVPLRESDSRSSEGSVEIAWVRDAISALGDVDRRVCQLCLVEGASYRDAARELGLTPGAVGKRLERVRARLRKVALDNEG
jgi:RNA polymerase sigma factor (sigma-70 family)